MSDTVSNWGHISNWGPDVIREGKKLSHDFEYHGHRLICKKCGGVVTAWVWELSSGLKYTCDEYIIKKIVE